MGKEHVRSGDDDLRIHKLLVKLGVFALLVRCCDQSVALLLNPLPQPKFVLGRSQKLRLLFGMDAALSVTY
jgi:hypothetical protein